MESSQNTLFKHFQLTTSCRWLKLKKITESCRDLTIFSVQAQSRGVLALYLRWVNIHTEMMDVAFANLVQKKELDYRDITSVQTEL